MAVSSPSVRVSLPMSVAADIAQFKKAVGTILEKLGCPACCSGHDIFFELQREFTFEDKLDTPRAAFTHAAAPGNVNAAMSPKVASNINEVYAAIDRIVGLSGHPNCTSGDDLFLKGEQRILIDRALKLQESALTVWR